MNAVIKDIHKKNIGIEIYFALTNSKKATMSLLVEPWGEYYEIPAESNYSIRITTVNKFVATLDFVADNTFQICSEGGSVSVYNDRDEEITPQRHEFR